MKAGTDMKDGFNLTWTRHYLRRTPFKYVQGFFFSSCPAGKTGLQIKQGPDAVNKDENKEKKSVLRTS